MDLVKQGVSIASNPKYARWLCPLLLVADAALCGLIIWKVPCTHALLPKNQTESLLDCSNSVARRRGY